MEYAGVVLVGLIIGLNEWLKSVGVNKKLIPIFSVVFGLIMGIVYVHPEDIKSGIIVGLSLGLSAIGLYSGGKNVSELVKK